MRVKKSISFILLLSLLLSTFTGLIGEKSEAAEPVNLSGEVVYSHNGYHDTWTTAWSNYDNPVTFGTDDASNKSKSYDRGKPGSPQSADIKLDATSFNVTTAEEFKKNFYVVPLNPTSIQALGLSTADTDAFITRAISASVVGGIGGATLPAYKAKHINKGVSNLSINNDGITMVGGEIRIPASYKLEAVPVSASNSFVPYGEDLRFKVLDSSEGIVKLATDYKALGKSYAEFKAKVAEGYIMPESSYSSLWTNGTLGNGVVGWRW